MSHDNKANQARQVREALLALRDVLDDIGEDVSAIHVDMALSALQARARHPLRAA